MGSQSWILKSYSIINFMKQYSNWDPNKNENDFVRVMAFLLLLGFIALILVLWLG